MALRVLIVSGYGAEEQMAQWLRAAGHEVELGRDEREGLELLRARRPDMLIVGARITTINGLDFIGEVRKQLGPALPVLFASACPTLEAATQALDLGVMAFTQLPCTEEELVAAVGAVVDKAGLGGSARG